MMVMLLMSTSRGSSARKEPGIAPDVPSLFSNVDPALVVAAQQGDAMALDRLLDELTPYVGRLCQGVAPNAADDATQEALMAIFRNLRRLRAPEAIVSWVRVLTVRAALRVARDAARELAAGDVPERHDDRVRAETLVDITDALERIPPEQRAVLLLRQFEGLSEREVAQALNLPVGTVRSRLHRARASFRKEWEG
jgi:RNA polymerase sigma factor (sigma-70 family)